MNRGLDFLKSRFYGNRNENNNLNLVDLPPLFKTFIENFEWNSDSIKNTIYFAPYLKGGEISLTDWNYQKIFSEIIKFDEEELRERGLISIATSNKGIYLGTKDEDVDKIFSYESSLENSFVVIADNIFQFVNGLTDNLSAVAKTENEYRQFMIELGYEEEDLEEEVTDWIKWKST